MVPTAFGEHFLERAEPLLTESARLHSWLTGRKLGAVQTLHIATDSVLSLRWLPEVLARFRERYPEVALRFSRHKSPLEEISAGHLDAAITFPQPAPNRRIEMLPLFEDEMVAVLPDSHPLTHKKFVEAIDLHGADFIYHMDIRSSVLYKRYLSPRHVKLGSITVIEQPQTIVELVRTGLGISFLPRKAVQDETGVTLRRLTRNTRGFRIGWSAAVRKQRETPWVDELVRLIRAEGA